MIDFMNVQSITTPKGEVQSIAVNGNLVWEKPLGYTELNYLIMPSGAWFNTGIVPSADKWTYETRIYAGAWGSNGYYYLAVRETKDYSTMYCPFYVQSGWRLYLSGSKSASAGGAKNTWYDLKVEMEDGLQNVYINDALKTTSNIAIPTTYTLPLYLFAANFHGGKYSQTLTGRIAYLRVYHGDELVRHFVAAKRNSDDVCGLLDKVTGKFYTNAGSGKITGVAV